MIKRISKTVISTLLLGSITLTSTQAKNLTAKEIMQRVDSRDDGDTINQKMKMLLISNSGKKRKREIKYYSKDYGINKYSSLFFSKPRKLKDTAFLTHDYKEKGKEDEQWLYLPALKKIKRIPTADKSTAFMGSDFSYFDMTDRNINNYTFKKEKETKVNGVKVWVISAYPKNQNVIDESKYKKTMVWVRKDNFVVIRSILFHVNGSKKYLTVNKIHKDKKGIWVTDKMTMVTKRGRRTMHKTVLSFSQIKVNTPIKDVYFTKRKLNKGA